MEQEKYQFSNEIEVMEELSGVLKRTSKMEKELELIS